MPYLFHSNKDDVRLLDCEGRTYVIPPNKAWKVPALEGTDISGPIGMPAYKTFTISDEQMAKHFLREGKHYGLVSVEEKITDQGILFDVKDAGERSKKARYDDQTYLLEQYVASAHDDELNKQPVRPPADVIQGILDDRGLDLQKDFGITPVGYRISEYAAARDEKLKQLEVEKNDQAKEIAELRRMLEKSIKLMERRNKEEPPPAA